MEISFKDQTGRTIQIKKAPQRVVSLVPSQTELLADLGLAERVVGITKFCIEPDTWYRSKTRVGGTKTPDLEKIRSLSPDLILANKEENRQEDILALEKDFPVYVSDVRNLAQACDMIRDIGVLTGTESRAVSMAQSIEDRFRQFTFSKKTACVYLIWKEPLMAVNRDTFISDMLERSGFINVFGDKPERYPQVDPAEILQSGAEVILLSSEPFPFTERDKRQLQELCPGKSILFADGKMFSWYGSQLLSFDPAAAHGDLAFGH